MLIILLDSNATSAVMGSHLPAPISTELLRCHWVNLKMMRGSECEEEVSNGLAIPIEATERQTSHAVEESNFFNFEVHTGTVPGLIQKLKLDTDDAHSPLSEQGTEATHKLDEKDSAVAVMEPNKNSLSNLEQKIESTNNSDEKRPPEMLLELNKNPLLADNLFATTLVGTENVLSRD